MIAPDICSYGYPNPKCDTMNMTAIYFGIKAKIA